MLNQTRDMVSTQIGSNLYWAPEVLGNEHYNSKADVWALGCILFELATLKPAFGGRKWIFSISQVQVS